VKFVIDNPVLRVPPAPAADAAAHFAAQFRFYADVSDVAAALDRPDPGFVLLDSRGDAAWRQAHIPGAIHLPTIEIPKRAKAEFDPAVPLVTYCWGPGCNGAARAALVLSRLGFRVKEMTGGIEYWIREGFPVRMADGERRRAVDELTGAVELA